MMTFSDQYAEYRRRVNDRLSLIAADSKPGSLYEPTRYVLNGGGKRIRAILVMLAAEGVGGTAKEALDAGCAVEILHNFTLVHDDIMDNADTRRGRPTVHAQWDAGTAILVGDVMIGLAHALLLSNPLSSSLDIARAFTGGIIDVCEGQAVDREFEQRRSVTLDEYLDMISMKTGRLVETAAEIGGIVGGGNAEQIQALKAYARNIGLGFQIQDDLLDIIAEEGEFGKKIGGDVVEGKKTYLFIRADQVAVSEGHRRLLDAFIEHRGLPSERVADVRRMYECLNVIEDARNAVRGHIEQAQQELLRLPHSTARDMLTWFANMLMNRTA